MLTNPETKYRPFIPKPLPDRQWPSQRITQAPIWCSSDLRDGNQALIEPMDAARKQQFFDLLVKIGFKHIEIGFPSASETEFGFVRHLIDADKIPDDVWIQVLTPARPELIDRSFAAVTGAKRAIVHFYNATSPLFRQTVFGLDQAGTIDLAVAAARRILAQAEARPETDWRFEYSPETFSATEPEFALAICNAVLDVWQPTPERKAILNLPATVEVAGPHIYADQIEWFCRNLDRRDSVVVSVHPHNDRGTGVAAAELAVMAGADRIEGCLFGNGERTGNVDLVTLALNLYTQGVSPGLDFSDMRDIQRQVEHCNQLPVHPRHPYAGDLVFTAFSGSHQDAIKKGFAAREGRNDAFWDVPYLPIDPADLNGSYEAVIRVNSQSGKGGVAWILEQDQGLKLPRRLQIAFSKLVQIEADASGKEMLTADLWALFCRHYHIGGEPRIRLLDHSEAGSRSEGGECFCTARLLWNGRERVIAGRGNGPIAAFVAGLGQSAGLDLDLLDYHEHALSSGADARAAAYIECRIGEGAPVFGVGLDQDSSTAALKAIISAVNNLV